MMRAIFRPALAALALAAAAAAAAQTPNVTEIDRIVAVVNGDVITLTELDGRIEMLVRRLQQQNTPIPGRDTLRRQLLERMVVERLQLALARERGIRVDDEAVNQVIARIAEENGMNLMQFHNVLQKDGYDFAEFRDNIRREIVIGRLQSREVESRIQVTKQEIDEFLVDWTRRGGDGLEYHLSHILVSVPESASPDVVEEARREAGEVLARLRDGADFREMAVAHSDGTEALNGGDLGWREAGELPVLFAGVVTELDEGEISEAIRSPNGFHILRLEEKRGEQRHLVEQVHARHVLIRTDELTSDESARQRLAMIRQRIAGGESFAELARAYSQDRASAVKGGDLGWMDPGDFVPAFTQALGKLQPGDISEPFKSRFGWHIAQVLARRNQDNTEAYLRSRARELLRQRKTQEELQQWVRRLRDEAYVELRLEG